jgi:RNA polymerase sigma-70 factor (ECF subfamily)
LRLAALHIRRSLIRFARHHFGPHGPATNHDSPRSSDPATRIARLPDERTEAPERTYSRTEQLVRLHDAVETLPDELREVTELIWFHEMTQADAARLLKVDERTVRRRWQRARVALHDLLQDHLSL